MSENQKELSDLQNPLRISRRCLVKSALVAAPVVLTLRSGAALARANASIFQCVQRDRKRVDAGQNPLLTPGEPPDNWQRETVPVKEVKDWRDYRNPKEFWVYQDPSSGDWFTEEGDPVNLNDRRYQVGHDAQGKILVLVDDMGQITGYGRRGQGDPITDSCLASIIGRRRRRRRRRFWLDFFDP